MANLGKPYFLGLSEHELDKAEQSYFSSYEMDPAVFLDPNFMNQSKAENRSRSSSISTTPSDDKAARKREIDRAYRERQKREKMQMKTNLDSLADQNVKLKTENDSLKLDNNLMNEILKSQTKEIDQFKTEFEKMKIEYKKQNALVQRLSELLACPDLQLENQRLKYENAQLRHNANLDHRLSQLVEENGRLELENRILKVQKDALCGKLVNENQ